MIIEDIKNNYGNMDMSVKVKWFKFHNIKLVIVN